MSPRHFLAFFVPPPPPLFWFTLVDCVLSLLEVLLCQMSPLLGQVVDPFDTSGNHPPLGVVFHVNTSASLDPTTPIVIFNGQPRDQLSLDSCASKAASGELVRLCRFFPPFPFAASLAGLQCCGLTPSMP